MGRPKALGPREGQHDGDKRPHRAAPSQRRAVAEYGPVAGTGDERGKAGWRAGRPQQIAPVLGEGGWGNML